MGPGSPISFPRVLALIFSPTLWHLPSEHLICLPLLLLRPRLTHSISNEAATTRWLSNLIKVVDYTKWKIVSCVIYLEDTYRVHTYMYMYIYIYNI